MSGSVPVSTTALLGFALGDLERLLDGWGEKPFRARQLMQWMHQRGCLDFAAMSDLARSLRTRLSSAVSGQLPAVIRDHVAADYTRKWLLDVGARNAVETVFIPERARGTLCVSTQVGCAVGCSFCATGAQGFNRNLSVGEIIAQVWLARACLTDPLRASPARLHSGLPAGVPAGVPAALPAGVSAALPAGVSAALPAGVSAALPAGLAGAPPSGVARRTRGLPRGPRSEDWPVGDPGEEDSDTGRPISNVVFMGMGEPLQNYEATLGALRILLSDFAYGLSRRRVTVSTSGVVPMMDRLADDCPVALAVSLHAPDDELRSRLVPLNQKYPLAQLLAACGRYLRHSPRDFITFEYTMIAGVNDTLDQARALRGLLAGIPAKVNLIPFNPFVPSPLRTSSRQQIRAFAEVLLAGGITATTRRTRGEEIDAACGQLAGAVQDRTRRAVRLHRSPLAAG